MNELKVFDFENQNVRTVVVENEPYFVGKDVAEVLGYLKARNAISKHVDNEDKKEAPIQGTLGGTQNMTVINESGLYALIFSSKLDSAKRFKRWVTSEVLPQIRKQGMFMSAGVAHEILDNPEIIKYLAEQVAKINSSNALYQQETKQELQNINKSLTGEYVTPQDIDAIQYAIKHKAEKILDRQGMQLTLETLLDMPDMSIYDQAQAHKKQKEEYRYALGKTKSAILVSLKKALGMKGNAPNNHIKRKDVDIAIQYVKEMRAKDVN
ncbi:BRO-N domain-containing protein [Salinicoccus roseus]|uniref:Bro-N domain-containing protein n=1 Tax=Salinicoccus roseus TaxID=45670 RepID=A0ABT4YLV8_9STAP|nr:Bro-N domain-containing protein [Salinicoccus roseus]MDB0581351.1 Bro-N domain-containing protein [Salinicoccus roseus]